MRKLLPGLVALAIAAGFSVYAWPALPDQVPTHLNPSGEVDGWSSRLVAAVLAPAVGVLMAVLFLVLPKVDPRRENYPRFSSTWWTVANAALVVLAIFHIAMLGVALGWDVSLPRVLGLATGAMFILVGNLMTRIRPNWFMGIRTPWTLSSDTVWRKTHRVGGVAFVIAGVAVALTGFIETRWVLYAAMITAGLAGAVSIIYSFVAWRAEKEAG